MPLAPGDRLGGYEILALIGAGGMGEVYRARDTKLRRPVAIKVLLTSITLDAARIARFEREAKLLAALNHPHIATLYGMEGSAGHQFLIMELVEGETLAERISRGALPLEPALRIALQVVDALEAAHEKGIVHRDLKPANIKITTDQRVKVLDFGLARATEGAELDDPLGRTHSPTLSLMATQAGLILGTAAYMSPEQAKGLQADHRSDIFSFGCVLFEMLTGSQAFRGDSVPEILASVLAREPDLQALPRSLNPRLVEALQRCLHKNPKQRWQAVGDLRAELETLIKTPLQAPASTTPSRSHWRLSTLVGASALLLGTAAATVATWLATRPAAPSIVRTTIASPGLSRLGGDHDIAITPDGSKVVYAGNNGTQLFVRSLDSLTPVVIASGSFIRGPFVSPDGGWVGFFDGEQRMMKVSITGGTALPIVDRIDGAGSRGATWSRDDTIIFATSLSATGLQRVSAGGGPVTVLTHADRTRGEVDHLWPSLLPDGRGVLFTATTNGPDAGSIAILDLTTGKTRTLLRGGGDARFLSSGHIVYTVAGTLRAVAFDPIKMEVRSDPAAVLSRLATLVLGSMAASYAVSSDGTLAYVDSPADVAGAAMRTLAWMDRSGKQQDIPVIPHLYTNPRVSPDGSRIAVAADDQQRDIWIFDIGRAVLSRLTMDPSVDTFPTWTSDSTRVIFGSGRGTNVNLWWQAADGSGSPERLLTSTNIQVPTSVTPDGRDVIFHEVMPETSADVLRLRLAGPRKPEFLVSSKSLDRDAVVSRDGRWLAYESNKSGTVEVFVKAMTGTPGEWQVSNSGGSRPAWGRDELFYIADDRSLMRVAVPAGSATWTGGTPTKLIDRLPEITGTNGFTRDYDVSPDGRRFVIVKMAGTQKDTSPSSLILVQHWEREVAARAPAK